MTDIVNTIGLSDNAAGWWDDVRCQSIIRIRSDRNIRPFWADNITSDFIQDQAAQFVVALEDLWHHSPESCCRLGVKAPTRGLTTRAEAGYG